MVTATNSNYNNGTLTSAISSAKVAQASITVTAGSSSKAYDGTALTNSSCTATGIPISGHTPTCTMTSASTITIVGSVSNTISTVKIKNSDGNDVTKYYNVSSKVAGTLTITGTCSWVETDRTNPSTCTAVAQPSSPVAGSTYVTCQKLAGEKYRYSYSSMTCQTQQQNSHTSGYSYTSTSAAQSACTSHQKSFCSNYGSTPYGNTKCTITLQPDYYRRIEYTYQCQG